MSHHPPNGGIDAFIAAVRKQADDAAQSGKSDRQFILRISDEFAFIRVSDLRHPLKFLRQAAGNPPVQFGTQGFRKEIVDDRNPARHYMAFVFVGYWLPLVLGWLALIAWEVLGYVRYGFRWSQNDVRCGLVGLRHGRSVRKKGMQVLADLIEQDLKDV